MGSLAFLSPDIIGGILGVSADNEAGRGAISGDFGAFFLTCAGAAPISLFGLTIIGRLFEISSTGIGETTMQPIIIEAVLVAMLLGALKLSKKEA